MVLADLGLAHLAALRAPVKDRDSQVGGDEISQIRERAVLRRCGSPAVKRERVRFDAIHAIEAERRQDRILRAVHIESRLVQSLLRHTEIRILALRHRLNLRELKEGARGIQIIDYREVFIQRWKK